MMLTREQVEQIRQRFEYGYAKPCYYDHGTQPAGMFIDHTEAFRDLKDMLAHDAEQRQTIDAQAQRIKELESENSQDDELHLQAFELLQFVQDAEPSTGRSRRYLTLIERIKRVIEMNNELEAALGRSKGV